MDTCHADETHTASSNLTVCKSYKMRSDEISAISTAIPLQCPIDRVILDCTNIENEEVTQEITILPVVKFRMLIRCNTRVTEPEGKLYQGIIQVDSFYLFCLC